MDVPCSEGPALTVLFCPCPGHSPPCHCYVVLYSWHSPSLSLPPKAPSFEFHVPRLYDLLMRLPTLPLVSSRFDFLSQCPSPNTTSILFLAVSVEDEMGGWHHWLNRHESEQTLGQSLDREAWCAAVHGGTKSWTWLSDWTTWITHPACGLLLSSLNSSSPCGLSLSTFPPSLPSCLGSHSLDHCSFSLPTSSTLWLSCIFIIAWQIHYPEVLFYQLDVAGKKHMLTDLTWNSWWNN